MTDDTDPGFNAGAPDYTMSTPDMRPEGPAAVTGPDNPYITSFAWEVTDEQSDDVIEGLDAVENLLKMATAAWIEKYGSETAGRMLLAVLVQIGPNVLMQVYKKDKLEQACDLFLVDVAKTWAVLSLGPAGILAEHDRIFGGDQGADHAGTGAV